MAESDKYKAKRKIEWTIKSFTEESIQKTGTLESNPFTIRLAEKTTVWLLRVQSANGKGFRVWPINFSSEWGMTKFLSSFSAKWKSGLNGQFSLPFTSPVVQNGIFIPNISSVKLSITDADIIDGEITFSIEIEMQSEKETTSESIAVPKQEKFFESKEFSDFTCVSSDGQEFKAHRIVLAMNSPVFHIMLNAKMEEMRTNSVHIEDINGEVLREMLRFIYCGKVYDLKKHAFALLSAADKYDLRDLKSLCADTLMRNISMSNIFETIALADRAAERNLRYECIEFIKNNFDQLNAYSGWTTIDSILMLKVLRSVLQDFKTLKLESGLQV